jgi:signal transduction histidine kinase
MREVLINLVLNAQQATSGEGKSITVLTRREEGRVLVSVTDQGCGIPADNVDKLFDPFFTTKTDGTGLGLSIVHRIVEAHDGLVYVDSTPGVGSSFTISLPAAVPVAATVG